MESCKVQSLVMLLNRISSMNEKATLQKYDSFQADLDPTWQWGGGEIKDTELPWSGRWTFPQICKSALKSISAGI